MICHSDMPRCACNAVQPYASGQPLGCLAVSTCDYAYVFRILGLCSDQPHAASQLCGDRAYALDF